MLFLRPRKVHNGISRRTTENAPHASAPRSEQKQAEGVTGPFQGMYVRSLTEEEELVSGFHATAGRDRFQ